MYNPETEKRLEAMTDAVAFEMLCCDLLAGYGHFQGIVPQGVGRIDGGKDAILIVRDKQRVSYVRQRIVFHFSTRKDFKKKLWEDIKSTVERRLTVDLIIFVTNRRVTPTKQDQIKADARMEFCIEVEVFDQYWLRTPLNEGFQRLRKQYLDIDYDPQVFRNLESILELPEKHPNRADLEGGAYYRYESLHDRIHGFLNAQRRCLIMGKPGHGKTALAMAIGWELLSCDSRHAVFYISAITVRSCERWLYHIKAFDHDWVTFIIDDCHAEPEQVRALLDDWPSIRNAKLMLISRPIDASFAGPLEENFQEVLKAIKIEIEPDEYMVGQIIDCIVKRELLAQREPGPLQPVLSRCRGDLHILEFLVSAWLKQPEGITLDKVPETSILEAVYYRYLGGVRETYLKDFAKIAALSQFEIPVESRWIEAESIVADLQSDAFLERFVNSMEEVPLEFLRYFHSTPARYIVRAAFHKGKLHVTSEDNYLLEQLAAYIGSHPSNLFNVFIQLHNCERDDLEFMLFQNKSVMEAVEGFVSSVQKPPSAEWLGSFISLVFGVWRWEEAKGLASRRLLQAFKGRVDKENRQILFRSLSLNTINYWLWALGKIDSDLTVELADALDYSELGLNSRHYKLSTVKSFIREVFKIRANKITLIAFFRGLDFKELGKNASYEGILNVMQFEFLARQSGASQENIKTYYVGLDFMVLGESSHDSGIATIREFLKKACQAGVSQKDLKTFSNGLDFKFLGESSRDVGLATVKNFLQVARQVGVSQENLNTFCSGLDWCLLGQKLSPKVNERPILFDLHAVCSGPGITRDMARKFVDGLGLETICSIITNPNAPDIIAVLEILLTKKCGYARDMLARHNVVFNSDVWLRSFIGRLCAEVASEQKKIQSKYLDHALKALRGYTAAPLSMLLLGINLDLKNWTCLTRNIKLADKDLLYTELEPLLRNMESQAMTMLINSADIQSLSFFASYFEPEVGDFYWRPRLDLELIGLDFSAKILSASLNDIAYPLLTLRFIGKPEWCAALANSLENDSQLVLEKLENTDIQTLDLFLWNLLSAHGVLCIPTFMEDTAICAKIIEIAGSALDDQENLIALCGTLHFWNWSRINEVLPFVQRGSAIQHYVSAAMSNSIKLIRLTAGLAALSLEDITAHDYQTIQLGLVELNFPLDIPSQTLAWKHVREWVEKSTAGSKVSS